MGIIHKDFDINNKCDRMMITNARKAEEDYNEFFKKNPAAANDYMHVYHYTMIMSWNQLVSFYLEMVNDKSPI